MKKKRNLSTGLRLLFLAGVFLLFLGLFTITPILSPNPAAAAEKETICHVSPRHPGHFRTLSIPGKAARRHLARHPLDYEGECYEPDEDCDTKESWLFVQTALSGTLGSDAAARACGSMAASGADEYTLTLFDVDSAMIAFSDRPARDVHMQTVSDFVANWNHYGFDDDPPNAALELMEPNGDIDVTIVELLDPVYDGNSLSYTVRPLSSDHSFLKSHEGRGDPIAEFATDFDHVTLFIDSATTLAADSSYSWSSFQSLRSVCEMSNFVEGVMNLYPILACQGSPDYTTTLIFCENLECTNTPSSSIVQPFGDTRTVNYAAMAVDRASNTLWIAFTYMNSPTQANLLECKDLNCLEGTIYTINNTAGRTPIDLVLTSTGTPLLVYLNSDSTPWLTRLENGDFQDNIKLSDSKVNVYLLEHSLRLALTPDDIPVAMLITASDSEVQVVACTDGSCTQTSDSSITFSAIPHITNLAVNPLTGYPQVVLAVDGGAKTLFNCQDAGCSQWEKAGLPTISGVMNYPMAHLNPQSENPTLVIFGPKIAAFCPTTTSGCTVESYPDLPIADNFSNANVAVWFGIYEDPSGQEQSQLVGVYPASDSGMGIGVGTPK